jgi:hypothetical protein
VCHPVYTGCPRRNVTNFGRLFLMLNYTDITQNTYIQCWTVTEIMAREVWNWHLLHTYWLPNTYWNWQEYVVSVMLISVLNIKLTCEWHKAIKLNYKDTRTSVTVVRRFPSTVHRRQLVHYLVTSELLWADCAVEEYGVTDGLLYVETTEANTFRWLLSP